MSNILVLVETALNGEPAASTAGLIAAASQLGSPVAVHVAMPGTGGQHAATLGHWGPNMSMCARPTKPTGS